MPQRLLASVGLGIAFVSAVTLPAAQAPSARAATQPAVDFATEIHPILEAKCLGCHGDKLKLSKLDLRTRESAIEGGAHGPSLVPGNAEQSRMYRHVAGLEVPAMPMRGDPLTAPEVAAMKRWIDEGAKWDAGAAATASTRRATEPAMAAFEDRPDYGRRTELLGFQAARAGAASRRRAEGSHHPYRPFPRSRARNPGTDGRTAGRSPDAGAACLSRSARPPAIAR